MIWICGVVFKGVKNRPIITHCYSSQGITTYVVFYVDFGGGGTYSLTANESNSICQNFFLNIVEIMDAPTKVAVQYSHISYHSS
jgi:hypothetical protein